jgi:uncharacterized iron-regulated membrane protein
VRWFKRDENDKFQRYDFSHDSNGELHTEESRGHLASFVYRLHYTAGLPSSFGLEVLGFICVIYGIALVSGVVIFLPNFLRDLFIVRSGKNKKRFWLDTHNVVGMLSLPWHIMFAWSGAVLAIGTILLAPFQFLVFDEDLATTIGPELGRVETPKPANESADMLSVSQLLAIAEREAPGITPTQLRYSHYGDANSYVRISGLANADTLVSRATLTLMTASGAVLDESHPAETTPGSTFFGGLMSLHFADFGGALLRWVYLILGFAGAYLFYSGNLLWIETRRKRRQQVQAKNTLFLARLNSGVCIGCMAAVSAAFLASQIFAADALRADRVELAYYLVFFAAIAWCFVRPVAAGTQELLYLSAVLTAGIPVLDIVLRGLTPWQSAIDAEWSVFGVQAVALLCALSFWLMGRALGKRARNTIDNSVWSMPRTEGADQLTAPQPTAP